MPTLSLPIAVKPTWGALASRMVARGLLRAHGIPLTVVVVKRIIDLAFALTILIPGIWIFPFIALAIYLASPGPIFYGQKRAAALRRRDPHGLCAFVTFEMLKFRTMKVDAEKLTGAVLAEAADPRV